MKRYKIAVGGGSINISKYTQSLEILEVKVALKVHWIATVLRPVIMKVMASF